ncbi:MAG: hypothetical protein QRY74_00275 [Chlamydia sp.]
MLIIPPKVSVPIDYQKQASDAYNEYITNKSNKFFDRIGNFIASRFVIGSTNKFKLFLIGSVQQIKHVHNFTTQKTISLFYNCKQLSNKTREKINNFNQKYAIVQKIKNIVQVAFATLLAILMPTPFFAGCVFSYCAKSSSEEMIRSMSDSFNNLSKVKIAALSAILAFAWPGAIVVGSFLGGVNFAHWIQDSKIVQPSSS